ncbi:phospholipase D-like domain-containing protein [uncultured Lamprocystis sp.]|jgi:hypothetical protein|uniref:phospholipase D-like domain-containing protein n=1 Tax=uncultured Lamprocystis sp. TaxID=543132 RepID=UPI0025D1398F|nr:phospholipase D-like domain-containing protein [uncultured Lamprocystis sp.]
METTAHFDNIPQEIAKRLTAATEQIVVAVARFTDRDIFDILCKKAGLGLTVRLAIPADSHNIGPGRLNFERLRDIGGEVFLLPAGRDDQPTIEHNFCVIDRTSVITGSHDWTRPPEGSDDGLILVITHNPADGTGADDDGNIAADYLDAFTGLLQDQGLGPRASDSAETRRRLEVIRHLLMLEDWDAVAAQVEKLRPDSRAMGLDPLFAALRAPADGIAAAWIDDYLQGSRERTLARHERTALLRLTVRALDYQITALRDEQADIERQIHAFSLRANHELGDLTIRHLALQAALRRRQAEADPALQSEAERAEAEYQDYREANTRARRTPPPPSLAPADLDELKRLYRQTSQRCHPDKVDAADQERAKDLFIRLQAAYRNNDLAAVRTIHAAVRTGQFGTAHGIPLTDTESLQHAIIVLRHDLDRVAAELKALRDTETYRTLHRLTDWDAYFDERRLTFEDANLWIEETLARMQQRAADPDDTEHTEHTRFQDCLRARPDILVQGLSGQAALSFELLRRYPRQWDWQALSANRALRWSPALIALLADRWDWPILSANPALPWTAELIQRFADRWDWDVLSDNAALPWGLDLIERFTDRWQPPAARHLRPLWERLQRQDIIDLMDPAPVPPVPRPEKVDDRDAKKFLDDLF